MMRLPPFRYFAPRSLAEAAALLAEHGPEAKVVAGGTDLYPNMKRQIQTPRVLVGLRALPELRGIRGTARDGLVIGANTTLSELSQDPRVREAYPALARAAGQVSTVHLRNMGTLGGNLCLDTRCTYYNQDYEWREALTFCKKRDGTICWVAPGSPRCWAVQSSDCAPVMVAMDARVRLVSVRGERVLPAAELYRHDGIDYLTKQPDEILTEVLLPPAEGLQTTYWKVRRRDSFDFPILGVAVALRRDNGTVRDARVVLGAVTSAPVLVEEARTLLAGQPLTAELIDQVAVKARVDYARPLDNTDLTMTWRRRMSEVYVRRALRELAGLPPSEYDLPMKRPSIN
jgi:4-hydroxybenzoyl-CoA reductase subunit beta